MSEVSFGDSDRGFGVGKESGTGKDRLLEHGPSIEMIQGSIHHHIFYNYYLLIFAFKLNKEAARSLVDQSNISSGFSISLLNS